MRLLTVISSNEPNLNAKAFSFYLKNAGIENECERIPGFQGKETLFRIWIIDEDQLDQAETLFEDYQTDPQGSRFKIHYEDKLKIDHLEEIKKERMSQKGFRFLSPSPYGKLSIVIIVAVMILFFWGQTTRPPPYPKLHGIPQLPNLSFIDQALLYDLPTFVELRDQLLTIYPPSAIEAKEPPPQEALVVIAEMRKTPFWNGLYDRVVNHMQNRTLPFSYSGSMFEKIGQGQIWRLVTPILLHFDFIHIFFNLLWFILLGNQVEYRLGFWRYLILILIAGIVANTAQYLMSGPFFMGLSGVVTALAGFIFARQQVAPWEGYLLNRMTLLFLAIFVFGVFALQIVLFFLEIFTTFAPHLPIANTAHIVGAFVGYFMGRFRFFSLQPRLHA
ncbi:MAG: rhomboid family intramembrane serine protease [Chlamydiia bacterium]|nr:rhomboid family intramembrane serine protease [Chlamydiia bacterium]